MRGRGPLRGIASSSALEEPELKLSSCSLKQPHRDFKRQYLCLNKKSGRGPPTAPTLRPRVLTPRDHFVHRGGERIRIMQ